jgi:hypothetical protein
MKVYGISRNCREAHNTTAIYSSLEKAEKARDALRIQRSSPLEDDWIIMEYEIDVDDSAEVAA